MRQDQLNELVYYLKAILAELKALRSDLAKGTYYYASTSLAGPPFPLMHQPAAGRNDPHTFVPHPDPDSTSKGVL